MNMEEGCNWELVILTLTGALLVVQLFFQYRVSVAQLHRDRFELYWKTYEPITDAHLSDCEVAPGDYMHVEKYEAKYRDNPNKIKRYIHMSRNYEYLAFTFYAIIPTQHESDSKSMRRKILAVYRKMLVVTEPLGSDWIEMWTDDLIPSEEFISAHEMYGKYYPAYASFVNKRIGNGQTGEASGVTVRPPS